VDSREIVAAGAVVFRKGPEVLLVHRPKYDDWSFPKGKLDPGEHPTAAAVREVAEETGLDVRLGPPLRDQEYAVGNGTVRPKRVHYWVGRLVHGDDIEAYQPNDEIDQLAWLPLERARDLLSYERDRDTLEQFTELRKRTTALVVLRHTRSRSRKAWRGDDRERSLTRAGEVEAERLVPLLAAYGVDRVVSSSSRRCWTTVAPYADVADLAVEVTDDLAEEDATQAGVAGVVHDLLGRAEPAVLCTHRPVLPAVFTALGVRDPGLEPGAMLVVHHRKGRVVATELHSA
jgi:8-oxo-dGTP diphosphatase